MLCQSYVPAPFGIEPFLELHGGSLDAPKRWRQEVAKPHLFRMRLPMRDNERRRRFMEFFNTELRGDRRLLMDKTGLTKGRVSQLFDPGEPFGEKAAASLAEKLNLPRDYFDRDEAPPTRESRLDHVGIVRARACPTSRLRAAFLLPFVNLSRPRFSDRLTQWFSRL